MPSDSRDGPRTLGTRMQLEFGYGSSLAGSNTIGERRPEAVGIGTACLRSEEINHPGPRIVSRKVCNARMTPPRQTLVIWIVFVAAVSGGLFGGLSPSASHSWGAPPPSKLLTMSRIALRPPPPTGAPVLVLSPTNGSVGSTVAAYGEDFPANSAISFSFGGISVGSNCRSDSQGDFPGSTGTSCTFVVPLAGAGSQTVNASAKRNVTVGNSPELLAYDGAKQELFVSNYNSNNVSVVSTVNDTVVATVSVGSNPSGIAYDSGTGQVFVANSGSSNVSVINDTNDSVVASISVPGYCPNWMTYDSAKGEIFVGDDCAHTVIVLSDITDSVIANILVTPGSSISGLAYDNRTGQVFEANAAYGRIGIINDSSNSVTSNVSVGSSPEGIAYDPNGRELFVANYGSNNLTVISDTTGAVVANLSVGAGPFGGVYDPLLGLVLVTDSQASNVTAISTANDSVVSTFSVGAIPEGIVLDPTSGSAYVADFGSNDVTEIYPLNASTNASAEFTLTSFNLSETSGQVGNEVSVVGAGFSANATISFTFGGTAVTSLCSTDSTGSFPGSTGTPCTFAIPPVGVGTYAVSGTDGVRVANSSYRVVEWSMSPRSAAIGSIVTANGSGFPADSPINFEIGPAALPSNCRSDSSGLFPGTTGAPCTFEVPPVPGGTWNVSVSAGSPTIYPSPNDVSLANSAGFGPHPAYLIYDSGRHEVFVTLSSADVGIINDSNDTLFARVHIGGSYPEGLAYDPVNGHVFIANWGPGYVSVVLDSNNTVLAAIRTGPGNSGSPYAVAYDSGTQQMFVVNDLSNNVSVISGANNSLVTGIGVGGQPMAIAYDPSAGEMFVANSLSNNVSVVSDSSDTVVASIAVGSSPEGIAYDSGSGEVFVTNYGSNNVSVISTSSNSVLASIGVGSSPSGIVYDPRLGGLLVANTGADNVSLISDASDTVAGTAAVGNSPLGVAYDSGTGQLFVANGGSTNVSVILGGVAAPLATSELDVLSNLTLLPSTGSVDVGETVALKGTGLGNASDISRIQLGNTTLSCLKASVGSCNFGALTTASNGSFLAEFVVPAVAITGYYPLSVNDSDGLSANATILVYEVPIAGTVSPSSATIDLGQSVTFTVSGTSSGSGNYSYVWSGLPTGCAGNGTTITCTPTKAGSTTVNVTVTDSNGGSVTSPAIPFTVFEDPQTAAPIASPSSGHLDAGQSVTLTTTATLGSGDYVAYAWYGLPGNCAGAGSAVRCSGTDLPKGNYLIEVTVTDSNGYTSNTSAALSFDVLPAVTVTTPASSRLSADVGQSTTFSASGALGSGSYSYQWIGLPSNCVGLSLPQTSCTFGAAGTYNVSVAVTDANHDATQSAEIEFVVYANPTVSVNASRTTLDVGANLTLDARALNGFGEYTYSWSGLPPGCAEGSATVSCSPSLKGSYSVKVAVTDSNGGSAESVPVLIIVGAAVTATLSSNLSVVVVGESVRFTAEGSGGIGALTYEWEFGDRKTGSGSNVSHTYFVPGNFSVMVWINDTVGGSISKSISVQVVAPASSQGQSTSGLSLVDATALIIIGVAAVAIIALSLLRRRNLERTNKRKGSDPRLAPEPARETNWEGHGDDESAA
jgi:YVTN family beta-propeller protein